ncbi:MAG: DNA repair protein RecO [Bacillota bacterium]|jgi:DNA repair protein RecO (recombination protein O)
MLYQTEGVVLSAMDLGEHDRLISILTEKEGLVRAVVRGARKPKSKLSALTQPFTRAQFQLFRGKSMDRVTQVSLMDSHPGIVGDYERLVYGGYISELVSCLVPERESNPHIYAMFVKALDYLDEEREPWTVTKWAELGFLSTAGFLPSLDSCSYCGNPISGRAFFSPDDGGALCEGCRGKSRFPETVSEVSRGALRTLSLLCGRRDCPNIVARGQVRDEAGSAMKKYIAHILGKHPKSLALVERLEAEGTSEE